MMINALPRRSLKDLLKTLSITFANTIQPPQPASSPSSKNNCLPVNASSAITAFLEKQSCLEDADVQKLHDELLNIRETNLEPDPAKLGPFLQALRLLRPAIKDQARIQKWWDLVALPIVDSIGHKRVEVDHAAGFLLDTLEHGAGEDTEEARTETSALLANTLLSSYLKRTLASDGESEGTPAEDEFVAKQLETVLVTYGSKKPKVICSDEEVWPTYRADHLRGFC